MANNNGQITAPVRQTDDVKKVLSETSNNLSALCMSANINKWAKFKPVIINSPFRTHSTGKADWYKGADGKCGLQITPFTSTGYIADVMARAYRNGDWTYIRLKSTDYHRLADFEGYWHNARPFLATGLRKGTEFAVNFSDSTTQTITFGLTYNNDSRQLGLADFNDLGMDVNCYLYADVLNVDPSKEATITSANLVRRVQSTVTALNSPTVSVSFTAADRNTYGDQLYILLYLVSTPSGTRGFTIPYDDNNYTMFKVNFVQQAALSGRLIYFLNNSIQPTDGGSEGYAVPTNNGTYNFTIQLGIANNYSTAITIGSVGSSARFNFRAEIGSGFGVYKELTLSTVQTIPANNQNWQAGFDAGAFFQDAINKLNPGESMGSGVFRVSIRDNNGAAVWQTLFEKNIWFKR